MNEKIREAFDAWYSDSKKRGIAILLDSDMREAYEAGYLAAEAEQREEVGELVEILKNLYENKSELDKLYIILNRSEVKQALAPYHEVPCEACGGSGDRSIGEDVNGDEMVEPCPTCKGKGNVWRRKYER